MSATQTQPNIKSRDQRFANLQRTLVLIKPDAVQRGLVGQIVARLIYERLTQEPDRLYGRDIGSSYQKQGLALSKHFRR